MVSANALLLEQILAEEPQRKMDLLHFIWHEGARGEVGDAYIAELEHRLASLSQTQGDFWRTMEAENVAFEIYLVAKREADTALQEGKMGRVLSMYKTAATTLSERQLNRLPEVLKEINIDEVTEAVLGILTEKEAGLHARGVKKEEMLIDYSLNLAIANITAWHETQKGNYSGALAEYLRRQAFLKAFEFVKDLPNEVRQQLGAQAVETIERSGYYENALEMAVVVGDQQKAKDLAQKVIGPDYQINTGRKVEIAQQFGLTSNTSLVRQVEETVTRTLSELSESVANVKERQLRPGEAGKRAEQLYQKLMPVGEQVVRPLLIAATDWYLAAKEYGDAHRTAALSGHPKARWLGTLMNYVGNNSPQKDAH